MIRSQKLAAREAVTFSLLCSLVYFTSYLTRINFTAVIVALEEPGILTGVQAGLISAVAAAAYGAGQFLSGVVGDHVNPRYLIAFGLSATGCCNFLMSVSGSAAPMTIIWGVNGICQALFWPPLVRMMAENLEDAEYSRACVWVSMGSSAASILVYLLAPLFIRIGGWRSVFVAGGVFGFSMAALWLIFSGKILAKKSANASGTALTDTAELSDTTASPENIPEKPENKPKIGGEGIIILAFVCLAITLQGVLRDGVTTWMPSFVKDRFALSAEVSILTGVALPVFSMFSFWFAAKVRSWLRNEILCSTLMFAFAAVCAAALRLLGFDKDGVGGAVFSVLMMSLVTACMHGINLMLITMLPSRFLKFGRISTISGVMNAFTYVGSSLSAYCFAALTARAGWSATVTSWAIVAGFGAALCAVLKPFWDSFKKRKLD